MVVYFGLYICCYGFVGVVTCLLLYFRVSCFGFVFVCFDLVGCYWLVFDLSYGLYLCFAFSVWFVFWFSFCFGLFICMVLRLLIAFGVWIDVGWWFMFEFISLLVRGNYYYFGLCFVCCIFGGYLWCLWVCGYFYVWCFFDGCIDGAFCCLLYCVFVYLNCLGFCFIAY